MLGSAGQSVGVCCYDRVLKEASTEAIISSLKVLYRSFKVLYSCSLVVLH